VRRLLLALGLLLLVAALPASARAADGPVEVTLHPAFVLREGKAVPVEDGTTLHPGDVVGLALDWPEGARPARPRLAGRPEPRAGEPVPLRLVPRDERAGGKDVLLVLLAALGKAELAPVELADGNGRTVARTAPLSLEAAPREDAQDPAPARPPVEVPPDWAGLAAVAAGLALLLAGAVLLARRLRGRDRPRKPREKAGPPPEPPEVRALRALDELLARGLLERGERKPFADALGEIAKGFFGEIAGVPLLERTTEECRRLLREARFDPGAAAWLDRWLTELDMVKFAEARPPVAELRAAAEELRAEIERIARERREAAAAPPAGAEDPGKEAAP